MSAQLSSSRKQVAILDFGSQYSHLIARRVRELHVFCELYSCLVQPEVLSKNHVVGVILAGGPHSVYEEGAPHVHAGVWKFIEEKGIPVLGICYGMQEIAHVFGGQVAAGKAREYGHAIVSRIANNQAAGKDLLGKLPDSTKVWMSHGDKLTALPQGFVDVLVSDNSPHAAIANPQKRMYGLQFHPEVTHSPLGKVILEAFVVEICKAPTDWNMSNIADEFIKELSVGLQRYPAVASWRYSSDTSENEARTAVQMNTNRTKHSIIMDTTGVQQSLLRAWQTK